MAEIALLVADAAFQVSGLAIVPLDQTPLGQFAAVGDGLNILSSIGLVFVLELDQGSAMGVENFVELRSLKTIGVAEAFVWGIEQFWRKALHVVGWAVGKLVRIGKRPIFELGLDFLLL